MSTDDTGITLTPNSQGKKRRGSPQAASVSKIKKTINVMENAKRKVGDMDLDELIIILNSSFAKTFENLLEKKLENVAKSEDLENFKGQMENIEKENKRLRQELEAVNRKLEDSESRWDDLANRSMRNNLIFQGLVVRDSKTEAETVQEFVREVLGEEVSVNRAHFLGRSKQIIAHIPQDKHIQAIFSKTSLLRGTEFFIFRDFTKRVRNIRSKLMKIRWNLRNSECRLRVSVVYDHLYVGDKKLHWTGTSLRCGEEDGWSVLRTCCPAVNWNLVREDLEKNETSAAAVSTA